MRSACGRTTPPIYPRERSPTAVCLSGQNNLTIPRRSRGRVTNENQPPADPGQFSALAATSPDIPEPPSIKNMGRSSHEDHPSSNSVPDANPNRRLGPAADSRFVDRARQHLQVKQQAPGADPTVAGQASPAEIALGSCGCVGSRGDPPRPCVVRGSGSGAKGALRDPHRDRAIASWRRGIYHEIVAVSCKGRSGARMPTDPSGPKDIRKADP